MTTARDWTPLTHLYPLGEPQPLSVSYRGLQYEGEVLLIEEWEPTLGQPLEANLYFRIVLLKSRRTVPMDTIKDSRIAVCVPGRRSSPHREALNKELTSVRETMATYRTQRDIQSDLIFQSLERRRGEVAEHLIEEEGSRYAAGHIVTPASIVQEPSEIFVGPDPAFWFQRLAQSLLDWSYSILPWDPSLLSSPLVPTDARQIFEAIFASTEGHRGEPLAELGPALMLSRPEAPDIFDPEGNVVFEWVRKALATSEGEVNWKELQTSLAHGYGLTHPFAILYLLAFMYYGRPEVELTLYPDHGLRLSDGSALMGRRVTRDLIPMLPWIDDISAKVATLRLEQEATWNDALLYTSLLCPGMEPLGEGEAAGSQEPKLMELLGSLEGDIERAPSILRTLVGEMPSLNEAVGEETLRRLADVSKSQGFKQVYITCRRTYDSPAELAQDLDQLGRMLALNESTGEVAEAVHYLATAEVPDGYGDLALERVALESQLSLSVLLADPLAWERVKIQLQRFKAHYRNTYLTFHRRYQQQALSLGMALESAGAKLKALRLLNSIDKLGRAMSPNLAREFQLLKARIKRCQLDRDAIDVNQTSTCDGCHLTLGEESPVQEVELFLKRLEQALAHQNRRLGKILVGRIIHGQTDQRLEDFLKMVRASDLSALSITLDEELADFIRVLVS